MRPIRSVLYEHMFVGTGTLRRPLEYREARRLRAEEGLPYKRIAARVGVSVATAHAWTRDIELTPEQCERNLRGPSGPANPAAIAARAEAWVEVNRERRRGYQEGGRARAREGDPIHMAGCLLYWAEGSKGRNTLHFANSDLNMARFFCGFLRTALGVRSEDIRLRLNVYTDNGLPLREIEEHWLRGLSLPRACLRGHTLNHTPTSSSGRKKNKRPYGVCTIKVVRSTRLVQHIFGAIQEYGGFEEPRWLD